MRATAAPELEEGEPFALAAENARRKAAAAVAALAPGEAADAVVLACDTVVALDGRVYGKPADDAQARSFLVDLQGRTHDVLGAVAIATPGGDVLERTDRTLVTFAPLTTGQIAAYVATGEWEGRAGGYAIQGRGRRARRGDRRGLPERRRPAGARRESARARARAPVLKVRSHPPPPLH